MDPGYLIGTLAFFTIGSVLLLSVAHFRQLLINPKDRFHIDNIMHDGKSATTMAEEAAPAGSVMPLKERLDNSIASQHPADPGAATSQADRVGALNLAKANR